MDSSDDSFAWTDASSDSSIMTPEIGQEEHNESGLDYKRNIQKEIFDEEPISDKTKKKKRKASEMLDSSPLHNGKRIKTEPESDMEPQKKKKKRKNTESKDRLEPSQDTLLAEEYLNLRVKQEQLSFVEPEPLKKKKKNHKSEKESEVETQHSESTESLTVENDSEINNINDNSINNCDKTIVEIEKFEAEETIVQKKKKKRKQDPKCSTSEGDETLHNNLSKSISSENFKEIEKPIITNGTFESDSDFEPQRIHITPVSKVKRITDKKKSKKSPKESPNTTRISDRLTFEDEESVDSENISSTTSRQLQQFVNMNTKLTISASKIHKENIITDNDEIWILNIPKEIDINDLKDSNFTLDPKWKIKINGQSYDGVIENHTSHIPLLCYNENKCQIKNMPLMGEVRLRKRIPKAHIPQETFMINNQTNFIPLPETKCRHPLFGVKYKKAIKIPKTIAKRLNGNIETDSLLESFSGKKEKKHKKEKRKIEKESEPEEDIEIQSPNTKKQKRKRKHSETIQDTITTKKSKKSKRAKLEPDSAEAWESERAIEENLFNF